MDTMCWAVSPTVRLAIMWHILTKLSSAQYWWAVTKNGNIPDCVKLRRGFSQLSFMYVLFPFSIFLITHFWVVLSFNPPPDTMLADLDFVTAYLDDILIKSKAREDHTKHVIEVFKK